MAAAGQTGKAKMFVNTNLKVEGEVVRRYLDLDDPMMGLVENIQFPLTVSVELSSDDSGHLMVSPIEINIGNSNNWKKFVMDREIIWCNTQWNLYKFGVKHNWYVYKYFF